MDRSEREGKRAERKREIEKRRRWTGGPGSTSTHLNFGPSQGQCGRPHPPCPPPFSGFFLLLASSSFSFVVFFFFSPGSAPLPCSAERGPVPHYRVIPCWDPRPPPGFASRFFPPLRLFANQGTREIPISGDTRSIPVGHRIESQRISRSWTSYRRITHYDILFDDHNSSVQISDYQVCYNTH